MSLKDTYNRCLKTMYGLRRFGIILELDTIRGILNALGNPQNNFACIHVAGTNGKGSVASALSSILNESGYKVGLYTSPHLVRFNERICINNRQISDADVVKSYKAVQQVHHGNRSPTFFEFATAMALYEFGRQSVDWAVIETGLSGKHPGPDHPRKSRHHKTGSAGGHRNKTKTGPGRCSSYCRKKIGTAIHPREKF
jgi:dihydrofolate synthase/folylpolyglutamate synthase